MVDSGRVASLLTRIQKELAHLRRSAVRSDESLVESDEALPAVKYRLVVLIESAVDVAEHIISSEALRTAQTMGDSFVVLAEDGWIDDSLADALRDAVSFRNLLVHQYADIDDARVIDLIRTRLGDFTDFSESIAAHMTEGGQ